MTTAPAPRAPLILRAGPAGYAALFSGEDAPEPAPRRPVGLRRATMALLADSARTLLRQQRRAQAFARSAT